MPESYTRTPDSVANDVALSPVDERVYRVLARNTWQGRLVEKHSISRSVRRLRLVRKWTALTLTFAVALQLRPRCFAKRSLLKNLR